MSWRRFPDQLAVSTHMQLTGTTRELGLLLGFTILFPIGILFFLNVLIVPALRVQVLIGTIMMETALLNVNVLAQAIGGDKQTKLFDLFVSLPISPAVYALSIALSILPFSLASAVVTLGVAIVAFHVVITPFTLAALVGGFVLVWGSTLGVGFLIGVLGRSPRQINSMAQLVGILLTFFVPVFYPASILPLPLRVVAYGWPLTWGAQFLVAVVNGPASTLAISGAVLVGFVVAWFALIGSGIRWRER